jgi:hypothetical protein
MSLDKREILLKKKEKICLGGGLDRIEKQHKSGKMSAPYKPWPFLPLASQPSASAPPAVSCLQSS